MIVKSPESKGSAEHFSKVTAEQDKGRLDSTVLSLHTPSTRES